MDSRIVAVDIPSAVRRFAEHADDVWSEFELSRAPDFGLGSSSRVAAGVAGQAVSE